MLDKEKEDERHVRWITAYGMTASSSQGRDNWDVLLVTFVILTANKRSQNYRNPFDFRLDTDAERVSRRCTVAPLMLLILNGEMLLLGRKLAGTTVWFVPFTHDARTIRRPDGARRCLSVEFYHSVFRYSWQEISYLYLRWVTANPRMESHQQYGDSRNYAVTQKYIWSNTWLLTCIIILYSSRWIILKVQ